MPYFVLWRLYFYGDVGKFGILRYGLLGLRDVYYDEVVKISNVGKRPRSNKYVGIWSKDMN